AFMNRKPSRDGDGGIRKRARLTHPEEKPRQQKWIVTRDETRQGSECRPPQHNPREDAARPNTISKRSAGNFKYGVGDREDACHPTPTHRTDGERLLNAWPGHRNTYAVEIRNDHEQAQQPKDTSAVFRRLSRDLELEFNRNIPATS